MAVLLKAGKNHAMAPPEAGSIAGWEAGRRCHAGSKAGWTKLMSVTASTVRLEFPSHVFAIRVLLFLEKIFFLTLWKAPNAHCIVVVTQQIMWWISEFFSDSDWSFHIFAHYDMRLF